MKRNLFLMLIVLVFSGQLLFAQRMQYGKKDPRPPKIEERIKNLDKVLNLSPKQKEQIKQIFLDADARMKKIYEKNKGNRTAIRNAMREQREMTSTQILNILNDKQKEAYKKYLKQRPKVVRENSRRGPRGGRMGRMRY